ncbi:ATP-binding cassette domain-containing protein (plasmid) [Thioclava litoralis]|uniref:ATP-binding cassette domain-containing protein n=1 Tax=Thioclava litoralis TaxID=3076557 RepID=A0ABZ1E7T5_9RHOB|nr:ATP-binding cassette domain-containing protein [Thioclava sp. FTW29]
MPLAPPPLDPPPPDPMPPDVLCLSDLHLTLRHQPVLNGLDLRMRAGQRIALLGLSGSGKSMTARAALGLLPEGARLTGGIHVAGQEVTHAPVLARPLQARPAMVMQDTLAALNPLATIGYQIEQPLRRQARAQGPRPCRRRIRAAALDLLARVGLEGGGALLSRCPPELSGGQRQRVCLAMALAARARVIIADEPTSALDVVTQAQILTLLRAICQGPQGPALLFITHDLHAAAHLCDEARVIAGGRIVEAAPMRALLSHPRHPASQALIASARQCGIACERLFA